MNLADLVTVVVYDYLWGLPLVFLVLGAGAFFTIKTGFFQFRFFKQAFTQTRKSIFGEKETDSDGKAGIISSFEAMSMALGTTIGVGNIGGVATAIAMGGPGAVFWMWVAGIFGLIIKTVEITLAVYYRSKDQSGDSYGGPNYYIHKGIGIEKNKKVLAKCLSFIFCIRICVRNIFEHSNLYGIRSSCRNV